MIPGLDRNRAQLLKHTIRSVFNATTGLGGSVRGLYSEAEFLRPRLEDDHELFSQSYGVLEQRNGGFEKLDHPALNVRLRDDFIDDCNLEVKRWNKVIEDAGIDFRLRLPHVAFHRHIGLYRDMHVSPGGEILSEEAWNRQRDRWLPGDEDRQHIESLMVPQREPNQYAGWIAPPTTKINRLPGDFEWVKLAE